ncbi:hypothetical protein DFS34DRAFT_632718 [Phlyctochytrium arcticum]|nr:hypothetical protein DFS34DRAFT_632718 [Phlyctochytrium arcticum]
MIPWRPIGFLALATCVAAKTPTFSSSGLFDLDVGLNNVDGLVAAYGDFDSDKFTDIFVLNTAQTSVAVYRWNHGDFRFDIIPGTKVSWDPGDGVITSVVPGDFNFDGKLDMLVMGRKNPNDVKGDLNMQIYYGNAKDSFNTTSFPLEKSSAVQPMIVDFYGDLKPNLLGYKAGGTDLSLWSPYTGTGQSVPVKFNSTLELCKISQPHSNAFVDIDGDCLADLVLTCDDGTGKISFEVWLNTIDQGFVFGKRGPLPAGSGQLSFADMDGDGTMDIIFPACNSPTTCFIHVLHNQQIPLCDGTTTNKCRDPHDLCKADLDFQFEFNETTGGHVVIPVADLLGASEGLQLTSDRIKGKPPISLRVGDLSNDGYPDILASTTKGTRLLRSVPCDRGSCTLHAVSAGRRTFELIDTGSLLQSSSVAAASFLDLDEDGTLDILTSSNEGGTFRIKAYFNNFYHDAFFLKALVTNGVCPEYCPSGERFPSPRPYGTNYVGATFKYTVLDTYGRRRAVQAAQLPQTTYFSLQTPYSLLGLGRTNNYLEDLFVGVTRRKAEHTGYYSGVIPNSQLILIPYQQDQNARPDNWKLVLFVNPSSASKSVMLVLLTSLIILVSVTGTLHYLEKREDAHERRRALHYINFDAL